MPLLGLSALSGLTQLGSNYMAYKGQQSANRTNIKLAEQARQHDLNMWQKTNEYNTPQMQMQRFKEAGLNPNLIYGQGSEGNASQAPKAPVPQVENELASLAQMSALPVISAYQDWRVKNAQIDNLEAQADATRQNASLTALRRITQDYTNKKLKIQLPWVNLQEQHKTDIGRHQADIQNMRSMILHDTMPSQIQQIILRNNLLQQQTRSYQLENQFNEQLKPYGMRSSDPLLMRLIMHVLPKLNIKLPKFIGQ